MHLRLTQCDLHRLHSVIRQFTELDLLWLHVQKRMLNISLITQFKWLLCRQEITTSYHDNQIYQYLTLTSYSTDFSWCAASIKYSNRLFQPHRKKKSFIEKKKAVTFHLVHRSQRDPLAADEKAPQHVLLPATKVMTVSSRDGYTRKTITCIIIVRFGMICLLVYV